MLKAFMSDVNGGPVWLDRDRIIPGESCFGMRAEDFAARWAENEARMILAETEPESAYSAYLREPGGAPGPWSRLAAKSFLKGSQAAYALAEALAGFCK